MRILHVTSGINPKSGGPTRSVKGMCRALSQAGFDVMLLVLGGRHPFENPAGVKVVYAEDEVEVRSLNLQRMVSDFDLVHVQGLWNPKLHRVVKACRKVQIPYVISPRGMLDPWALSVKKWKKRLGMFLYQRSDLKYAVAFHATAELEASNIRAQGLKQPIFIAPNGVDVPDDIEKVEVAIGRSEIAEGLHRDRQRTAIFLGRLHPGKGLLSLAEAWACVKPQGWTMRIVGPDAYGHKAEVLAKLDELGIRDQWQFVDMVDDKIKWQEYAAAELLVHPSVSENFGITIAEGLFAGLPVIATKGTPWRDLLERRCGWWIDVGIKPLVKALAEATKISDDERKAMGMRGSSLAREKYSWPSIAIVMERGYRQILGVKGETE